MSSDSKHDIDWRTRWVRLARRAGLEGDEPVLIALSGGADSVLLLHLAARSEPRPPLFALHVDHGLRGDESAQDARFCERLCAELDVPFALAQATLDPHAPDLEARARRARYELLASEARRVGAAVIATAHHADDSLETLVMRWLRGTELAGLSGIERRSRCGPPEDPILVVRPLLDLRRGEIRALLEQAGIGWREDSSNADRRFTRNRVRRELLPQLAGICGPDAIESLFAFGRAVATLEDELARRTAHIAWSPPLHGAALHGRGSRARLGGTLPRSELASLPAPLRRRVLWRLVTEGTGRSPSKALLDALEHDLAGGRCARHSLPGAWSLQLRTTRLHLSPPPAQLARPLAVASATRQLELPFAAPSAAPEGWALALPGLVSLPDGRAISAELAAPPPGSPVPRSGAEVELDAEALRGPLVIRWPKPGDRFHALGAPGRRPLARFLADAGVPAPERAQVPLVFAGDELVWVAGLRPAESRRVRRTTARRLRLTLHGCLGAPPPGEPGGLFG